MVPLTQMGLPNSTRRWSMWDEETRDIDQLDPEFRRLFQMETENYHIELGAAWDDPDEAAEELENGVV